MPHEPMEGVVAMSGENLPWVEKYRPDTLSDVVSHNEIVRTLNALMEDQKLPHLLFYGPAGTGKTSTILAIAKQLYGKERVKSMVLELNASDDRGIGIVRNDILSFAETQTLHSAAKGDTKSAKYKLVILDEADAMTKDAQNALRRVIEKYTENVRFCIICNYLSKIIPAIQSRCTRFRFTPIDKELIAPIVEKVCQEQRVNITPCGRQALMELCGGDMRRVLNILQSVHLAFDVVNSENIYACIGKPNPALIEMFFKSLMSGGLNECFDYIFKHMVERSFSLIDLMDGLAALIVRCAISNSVKCRMIEELATVERNLSTGCCEKLQLATMVGRFVELRKTMNIN
uniref:AAA domain-containing protein n=1 Tax=Rhabditophanes sp. KR3021 TaxID=114890 RepID=A0AC35TUT7_9BILA